MYNTIPDLSIQERDPMLCSMRDCSTIKIESTGPEARRAEAGD
jgi:hypothetical protein